MLQCYSVYMQKQQKYKFTIMQIGLGAVGWPIEKGLRNSEPWDSLFHVLLSIDVCLNNFETHHDLH